MIGLPTKTVVFKRMKKTSNKPTAFFGGWKDFILPAVFCACSVLVLSLVLWPISRSVALAADTTGYSAAPSPNALFVRETPVEPEIETVDLADYGGMPVEGELYGTVRVSGTSVNCNLYYGDNETELNAGAGTFTGAQIPGQGGVTLVGAHTGSYFRDLESVQLGADVAVETKYGTYHYTVTDLRVVNIAEYGMDDLFASPPESLLLYTCYPFGQLTVTSQRYLVTSEYVSGPVLTNWAGGGAE